MTAAGNAPPVATIESRHYLGLFRHTLTRQILLYFMPLLLLAAFFHLQYRRLLRESVRAHLAVIAEHQATTFDLFLRERLVNLANVIDDPLFAPHARDETYLVARLAALRQANDAFADLGVVSATLGRDSVTRSLRAGLWGALAIFAFMAAAAESKKLNGAPVLLESVIGEAEREAVVKMRSYNL